MLKQGFVFHIKQHLIDNHAKDCIDFSTGETVCLLYVTFLFVAGQKHRWH